jgi:hypothetical protein
VQVPEGVNLSDVVKSLPKEVNINWWPNVLFCNLAICRFSNPQKCEAVRLWILKAALAFSCMGDVRAGPSDLCNDVLLMAWLRVCPRSSRLMM